MDIELTRQEDIFRKSMGVLCILFLIGAVLFGVLHDELLRVMNWVGGLFGMQAPLVPTQIPINKEMWETLIDLGNTQPFSDSLREFPGTSLWEGMSVTMMIMIAFIAGANFLNPRKYIGWIPILLVSKFTTSALGLLFFFFHAKYLSNIIMTITDFPIFLFILVIWLRARSAQKDLELPDE